MTAFRRNTTDIRRAAGERVAENASAGSNLKFENSVRCAMNLRTTHSRWRGGRVVECAGLENQSAARYRGFESHPLYHEKTRPPVKRGPGLFICGMDLNFSSSRKEPRDWRQMEAQPESIPPPLFSEGGLERSSTRSAAEAGRRELECYGARNSSRAWENRWIAKPDSARTTKKIAPPTQSKVIPI